MKMTYITILFKKKKNNSQIHNCNIVYPFVAFLDMKSSKLPPSQHDVGHKV